MEMPKIYVNPPRSEWPALTARCTRQEEEIGERVAAILAEVRTGGDAALRRIVRRIEGYLPETFEVTRERRAEAAKAVSPQLCCLCPTLQSISPHGARWYASTTAKN